MKKIVLTTLLTLSLLTSCDKQNVYKEFDRSFDENRWLKSDIKTYDFALEKAGKYDLQIDYSHVAGFQFTEIPIRIEIVAPSGAVTGENYMIQTKDDKGNDLGDCTGDLCDIRQTLFKSRELSAGNYKIRLINEFDNEYLPNTVGLGIRLNRSK